MVDNSLLNIQMKKKRSHGRKLENNFLFSVIFEFVLIQNLQYSFSETNLPQHTSDHGSRVSSSYPYNWWAEDIEQRVPVK